MRSKALTMALLTVIVSVFVIALPLGVLVSKYIVDKHQRFNYDNALEVSMRVDSLLDRGLPVNDTVFERTFAEKTHPSSYVQVMLPNGENLVYGKPLAPHTYFEDRVASLKGALVTSNTVFFESNREVLTMWFLILVGMGLLSIFGTVCAFYFSHKLSVPLIYLAAQAESVGAGGLRSQVQKSGIEEIDLVQAELTRSAEKIARRIAAERHFASNASHQLRTPLTALSMRVEEIELISDDKEVRKEAELCLEQIERLTQVVQDLLHNAKNNQITTQEPVFLFEVFDQQHKEWDLVFRKAKRDLIVIDETKNPVLATRGYISQVIATLIENSLKYGAGTTSVVAYSTGSKGSVIDVFDEGDGVAQDIADRIFEKNFSGHGSSGLGLGIAKDLVEADGGRIELVSLKPPIFRISLTSFSGDFMSDNPNGVMVGVGRRRRSL